MKYIFWTRYVLFVFLCLVPHSSRAAWHPSEHTPGFFINDCPTSKISELIFHSNYLPYSIPLKIVVKVREDETAYTLRERFLKLGIRIERDPYIIEVKRISLPLEASDQEKIDLIMAELESVEQFIPAGFKEEFSDLAHRKLSEAVKQSKVNKHKQSQVVGYVDREIERPPVWNYCYDPYELPVYYNLHTGEESSCRENVTIECPARELPENSERQQATTMVGFRISVPNHLGNLKTWNGVLRMDTDGRVIQNNWIANKAESNPDFLWRVSPLGYNPFPGRENTSQSDKSNVKSIDIAKLYLSSLLSQNFESTQPSTKDRESAECRRIAAAIPLDLD